MLTFMLGSLDSLQCPNLFSFDSGKVQPRGISGSDNGKTDPSSALQS